MSGVFDRTGEGKITKAKAAYQLEGQRRAAIYVWISVLPFPPFLLVVFTSPNQTLVPVHAAQNSGLRKQTLCQKCKRDTAHQKALYTLLKTKHAVCQSCPVLSCPVLTVSAFV